MVESLKLALSFLTIAPVKLKREPDSSTFAGSLTYFPLAGMLIGCILAAIWYAFVYVLGIDETVVSVVVVVLLVSLTRMLHLDGLVDTFDGLLGGRDRDHALDIMKDSRVGSFGVVALVCTLIAKIVFLADLDAATAIKAIVFFPVVSKWAACYAMITQPYARQDGLGALFSKGRKNSELIIPSLITVVIALILLNITGLIVLIGIWVLTVVFLKWVRGKIGGITGDIVGALIEMSEVLAIFLLVVEKQILF